MSSVTIVDSGVANLASIRGAFESLGARAEVTDDATRVAAAERVVLPGVGHFAAGLEALRRRRLDAALTATVDRGTPLLAVCLGLQMLCESSEEAPGTAGLGVIAGACRRLPGDARLPHLGWNGVGVDRGCRLLANGDAAFANSYALAAAPAGWAVAWTRHGHRFVSALERGNLLACQFHPELSGRYGRELLERWLGRVRRGGEAVSPLSGLSRRIIPCLDVRRGRVVKGVRFQGLRDAGDPAARAAAYERQGADEIVLLDVAASPEGLSTHLETVRRVRAELSIPLSIGGGVRSTGDARRLLAAGADKVAVNTAAVERPELVGELASRFGSQCTVAAVDARRNGQGWEVLVRGGRQPAGLDATSWTRSCAEAGAGEILLTSWDRDGTRAGCDLELLRAVSAGVAVPVIASGGIGTRRHVAEAFDAGADAALAASIFHDGERSVAELKSYLASAGYRVRA